MKYCTNIFFSIRLFLLILVCSLLLPSISYSETEFDKDSTIYRAILFTPEGTSSTNDFLENFEIFVRDGLTPLGINAIVFDMHWNNYQFTSVPELKQLNRIASKDFRKSDASMMSKICKDYGISVIVGMNFLTHQNHGQLLKAFPDYVWPGKDNLWDPLNPDVNSVVFKMVDELVDAFSPVAFHVGMDEGWGFNADELPSNSSPKLSNSELLAKSISQYHNHIVNNHGIEMMMWSDMLEGRYEDINVEKSLDLIPKDIIMVSWNYFRHVDYPWPRKLAEMGFRVIVSPFEDLLAAEKFLKQSIRDGNENLLGVLYTTWSSNVVTDLSDALIGKVNKAKLDRQMIDVAETLTKTIHLFE